MTFLSWILSLWIALSQAEQGVIVRGPLQIEGVPALARVPPDQLKGAEAVWVWSPFREPQRLTPEEVRKTDRQRFGSGRFWCASLPQKR